MRSNRAFLAVLLLCFVSTAGTASSPAGSMPPVGEPAPRLALVLSGGGARGAAHIGVLRVLEELQVAPDIIVGTSMGAIVGGLYAAGWSPDELEALLIDADWDQLFSDRPLREEESFRRKQDDTTFLIPMKLRFRRGRPYIPPGVIGGQRLDLFLKSLELRSTGIRDFDLLPIRYRAVATDLLDGSAVVLSGGSLSRAMRASMAVPAMFPPVEIDGRRLVDGGAAANMPVGIAQSLGAEHVIAVDITSPAATAEELQSLFAVLGQQFAFLTVGNRIADEKRLRSGDVLIQPELGDLSFGDFQESGQAIVQGEVATRAASHLLREFALPDDEWSRFQARHVRHPRNDLTIDRLVIRNSSPVDDRVVRSRLHVTEGSSFDDQRLTDDVLRLHALQYFGTIEPEFGREEGEAVLTLPTPRPPYGRNSLQFGVNLQDDFDGNTSYGVAARHQFLAVNRRGGEWQNIAQMGNTPRLETEFYQPLDYAMRWFVAPSFAMWQRDLPLWSDGEQVADYRLKVREGHLDGGLVLGSWGELRAGLFAAKVRASRTIGEPVLPEAVEYDAGIEVAFRVDTLDDTVFPTRGTRAEIGYQRAFESLGSDFDAERLNASFAYVFHFGRNILIPSVEASATRGDQTTLSSVYTLGGFLRLSGLAPDELLGADGGLARVVYYRKILSLGLGALRTPIYAGVSLETGNVYQDDESVTLDGLRTGGSVFVAADTVLGPVYLAYGFAADGSRKIYLNIGARF